MRSDPRYQLCDGANVQAVVARHDEGIDNEIRATVLDLSRGGGKFGLPCPLPIRNRVSVRLIAESIGAEVALDADVCWARPMGQNQWWMGCAFDPPMPEKDINQLAQGGCIERRQNTRCPQNVPAKLRWELETEAVDVSLVDLSVGGFGLELPTEPRIGGRLQILLEPDNPHESPIHARIQWCRREDDHFKAGCIFLNREGFPEAQRRVALRNPALVGRSSRVGAVRRWIGIGLGLLTAAAAMGLGRWP